MYSEHLDLATLNGLLQTNQIGRADVPNEVWDEIGSTNARAIELAATGAPHGVIVAGRSQTAGRGRQGRQWVSPLDSGLYISFLLRPRIPMNQLPLISLATGVAVADAIAGVCGAHVGLKWVNDVVHDGRKLGGILAEMPSKEALVVGIGINLRTAEALEADPELSKRATAIEALVGTPIDPNQLAARLALELERTYILLVSGERTKIIDAWSRHSVTLGAEVQATIANERVEGTAVGLDFDGSLIVRTVSGDRTLHAGEVSIRRADGSYS